MKNRPQDPLRRSRIIAIACIGTLLLLQLPFLHSDPDYFLSIGRDAFTDEGLNTSQLRNYINYGYLDLNECDNMIKTPLFNVVLFLPLKLFGTHLIVARLTLLILFIIALLVLLKNEYFVQLIPLLLISTLTQYYVFQYSHFSLSEMLSITCILMGVHFVFRLYSQNHSQSRLKTSHAILSALFFSMAYYSKIQYVYIIVLLPASILYLSFIQSSSLRRSYAVLLKSILWLTVFALIYLVTWYFPFRATFDFVMSNQSTDKFATPLNIPKTIGFNILHTVFSGQTWWFNSLALICFLTGIYIYRKNEDQNFRILFPISSLWMVIELHKLSMIYLPSRYLVSYYFAAGLMCSVVLLRVISISGEKTSSLKFLRLMGVGMAILFIIANSLQYTLLLQRKTYHIEAINQYFSATLKTRDQPVMGPWAPAATWDCKAKCIPVWKDFMNDKDLINRFHPQAIHSEPDESESNQAYSSQRINLLQLSDSTRTFQLGRWDVIVYWLK